LAPLTFPRPPRNPQSRRHYSSLHRAFFRAKSSWCALGVRPERAQHRTRGAARGSSSVVVGAAAEHRRRLMHAGWMDGSLSLRRASERAADPPTESAPISPRQHCALGPQPVQLQSAPARSLRGQGHSVYMQSANFRACHCQSPSLAMASFLHIDFASGVPQFKTNFKGNKN
jgi:hypothetical protein